MAPSVQRLHRFPSQDHDAPLWERAVNLCSWSCCDVYAAMVFDRFLSSGKVLLRVSFLVGDLIDRNHVDGRLGLGVKTLNHCGTERDTCEQCQCDRGVSFHDFPPCERMRPGIRT